MMYDDAKKMTEDQFLSLFEWDHNMLVSSGHEDIDMFWNLTPLFRKAHREKTKADAKIIAKSRRIRKRQSLVEVGHLLAEAVHDQRASPSEAVAEALTEGFLRGVQKGKRMSAPPALRLLQAGERELKKRKPSSVPEVDWKVGPTVGAYWMSDTGQLYKYEKGKPKPVKKIQSRGFDKTRSRKMSGKVVKRER
jgi:hypothetical protein